MRILIGFRGRRRSWRIWVWMGIGRMLLRGIWMLLGRGRDCLLRGGRLLSMGRSRRRWSGRGGLVGEVRVMGYQWNGLWGMGFGSGMWIWSIDDRTIWPSWTQSPVFLADVVEKEAVEFTECYINILSKFSNTSAWRVSLSLLDGLCRTRVTSNSALSSCCSIRTKHVNHRWGGVVVIVRLALPFHQQQSSRT